VLDLGCGAGVLAIAAAKTAPDALIMASDIDPVAVAVTFENADLNGVGGRILAFEAAGLNTPEYGWEELPGEGAFYAPKLEFHLMDAIGRTWQVGTIQSDRVLPERLDASYIGEDGERHRPVMLHRAIFGSYERFIGILIEHYAGKLPHWLAPEQAVVASITNEFDGYANEVAEALVKAGLRAQTDLRAEKINFKVRDHSLKKVPFILAVGGRDAEARTVALRRLGSEKQEILPLDEAVLTLVKEATPPA
jgi:threonyl-tRNA synthetase